MCVFVSTTDDSGGKQVAQAIPGPKGSQRLVAGTYLLRLVGALLAVSAILKVYRGVSPTEWTDLFGHTWGWQIAALAEWGFAVWLMSGFHPGTSRKLSIGLFLMFAGVNIYALAVGRSDCGCFGQIAVSPWATLALDGVVVAALIAFPPAPVAARATTRGWVRLAGLWVGLGGVAIAAVATTPAPAVTPEELAGGRTVVLEPERWAGRPFPLSAHIRPEAEFGRGVWVVVLYHPSCAECRSVLEAIERRAPGCGGGDRPRVAFVEVPAPEFPGPSTSWACGRGRLASDRDWLVRTPVAVRLHEGTVTAVTRRAEECEAWVTVTR